MRASALESDDAPADATAALDAVEATPAAALKPRATGGPSWPEVWVQRLWTKRDFLHAHAISGTIFLAGGFLAGGGWVRAALAARSCFTFSRAARLRAWRSASSCSLRASSASRSALRFAASSRRASWASSRLTSTLAEIHCASTLFSEPFRTYLTAYVNPVVRFTEPSFMGPPSFSLSSWTLRIVAVPPGLFMPGNVRGLTSTSSPTQKRGVSSSSGAATGGALASPNAAAMAVVLW